MGADGAVVTYARLDERSNRLARLLVECGLRRGDHYAVWMENNDRYHEVVWAGLRSGLYVTAINSHLTAEEAAYIATDCEARVLVTSAALAERAAAVAVGRPDLRRRLMVGGAIPGYEDYEAAVGAFDPAPLSHESRGAVMLYSSGTTGQPKGVSFPLPEGPASAGEAEIAENGRVNWGFSGSMTYLSPAPLYHAAPLRTSLGVQSLGGTVVVMERFDAARALALIERERVTHSQWVPTMFVRMLKLPEAERRDRDLSSHQVAIHAAAPCPVAVKEQMIEWWGPILYEYYAGTENLGGTAITSAEWLTHKGSVGRPMHGAVLHICDEEGAEVPVGEVGTVYFEFDRTSFEYHGDAKKMAEIRHPEHPTWRTLGDMGRLDAESYLYLTDRRAFLIVAGGVNIYPQEIEDVLVGHPEVYDVGVIGVPDEDMGEAVKAVVQPLDPAVEPAAFEQRLRAYVDERLAPYKRPRSYDVVAELPRLENGKLYKSALRAPYWAGHTTRIV
jgi:fatty-acyl-CoA synthase